MHHILLTVFAFQKTFVHLKCCIIINFEDNWSCFLQKAETHSLPAAFISIRLIVNSGVAKLDTNL